MSNAVVYNSLPSTKTPFINDWNLGGRQDEIFSSCPDLLDTQSSGIVDDCKAGQVRYGITQ